MFNHKLKQQLKEAQAEINRLNEILANKDTSVLEEVILNKDREIKRLKKQMEVMYNSMKANHLRNKGDK